MANQVFGTKEWAARNFNFTSGCSHDCKYCYAKSMAIRFGRKTSDNWTQEVVNLDRLKDANKHYNGRIMIPSSHDITPNNIDVAVDIIQALLRHGNELLIVSKPHLECIERMLPVIRDFSDKVTLRFTIGSCHDDVLHYWEPGAPSFEERLACLRMCFDAGLKTSVSAEPILDPDTRELIRLVSPYVTDAIWIGIPNMLVPRMRINGNTSPEDMSKACELTQGLSNDYVMGLVGEFDNNSLIKWKESIKKIAGINLVKKIGEDM